MSTQTPSHLALPLPDSLEDTRIAGLPSTAYYIADFITVEEEQTLLQKIGAAPKPRWKHLSKRRLQTWPSDLNKNTLLESPLPEWLVEPVISRLQSLALGSDTKDHIYSRSPHGAPNHVLINEYLPGQGIMPHKDGSAYYPVVCTVSLGSTLCLDIHGHDVDGVVEKEARWKILQEPRSLLITMGELYTDYLHGIAEITEDTGLGSKTVINWEQLRDKEHIVEGTSARETRTSLTYRDVLKVVKLGNKFGVFGKR